MLVAAAPDGLVMLPERILSAWAWWQMFSILDEGHKTGKYQPISIPRNVDIHLCRTPDEVRAIDLRHPCADCVNGTMKAIAALEEGTSKLAIVVQVTFDRTRQRGETDL